MAEDIRLKVAGLDYLGWTEAEVSRSLESIAGSFRLGVRDAAKSVKDAWPVHEEDECTVLVGGKPFLTGYVDSLDADLSTNQHTLRVAGRDRAAALVDCSVMLSKWEFNNVDVLTLARRVAEPFGVKVSLGPGIALGAPPEKTTVDPGESAFSVIDRLCRKVGLLAVSDGQGGVQLMRPGATRAVTQLVQGSNIIGVSGTFDASSRFRRYIVQAQHPGSDTFFGESTAGIRGEATDADVRRSERVLVVRAEGAMTAAQATVRARWEAATRAARADTVTVTVQGWTQGNGALWPLNALVRVRAPAIRVDGDMLITETTFSVSPSSGSVTRMTLRRPDAFKPEPQVKAGTNWWREIQGGVT